MKPLKLRFSIRYKILTMVTALLVTAIGLYLLLATRTFQQDKQTLVFDLNRSFVTTLAAQVDTTLRGVTDKMRLYALLQNNQTFRQILTGDPYLVHLEIYEMGFSGKMTLVDQISDDDFSKLYKIDNTYFNKTLSGQRQVPFGEIQSSTVKVWNATVEKGPALLGMGIPVVREGNHNIPEKIMAVVGYVRADGFLKNLTASGLSKAYIVTSDGKILVHANSYYMTGAVDFSKTAIVQEGLDQLGAYAKVATGELGVISQIENKKAFSAVQELFKRSLQFALIISTLTFIITIFFSRTLTKPLQRLVDAMENVATGKLDVEIKVKSHDEIAILSQSFNQMTLDLRTSRQQLEEINRELENKVIDRTRKLEEQNRAVKEAQEALLRTTRLASVGEIAGRTAHEVLNPLTSLMARVQKVQKRLNEEVFAHKNLLGEIVGAWKTDMAEKGVAGFLTSLQQPSTIDPKMTLLQEDLTNINEIFTNWDKDLGTLETDTQFLLQQAARIDKILKQMRALTVVSNHKTQFSLHTVLHDAVNIVSDLFAKNKVEIVENYGAGVDGVKVDRDEMIQVLTNILRNSLQAVLEVNGRSVKGAIVISTSNAAGKIYVDITDNGAGISNENQPKLFESQFSTKAPDVGTGLGLSISRRFIRGFDGDLYLLKTGLNEGSTFRIELPLQLEKERGVAA